MTEVIHSIPYMLSSRYLRGDSNLSVIFLSIKSRDTSDRGPNSTTGLMKPATTQVYIGSSVIQSPTIQLFNFINLFQFIQNDTSLHALLYQIYFENTDFTLHIGQYDKHFFLT